jgi:hypothetical protein
MEEGPAMRTEFYEALETSVIRSMLRPVSPIASVYWLPPIGALNPQVALMMQRRHIAGYLAEQGADNMTIDAVVGYLARLSEYTTGQAVFARDGEVVVACRMPEAATASFAAYAAPAKVGPLLAARRQHTAYAPPDVCGAEATIEALAAGAVRRLMIVDDPADRRLGWFGPDLLCATERISAFAMDRFAHCGHLTDIAIRAAMLTGADVDVLDEADDLPDGMAAWVR